MPTLTKLQVYKTTMVSKSVTQRYTRVKPTLDNFETHFQLIGLSNTKHYNTSADHIMYSKALKGLRALKNLAIPKSELGAALIKKIYQ